MAGHADNMTLVVRQPPEEEKPLLRRLLELNAYEFSAIDGQDIGTDGEYGYRYLDHYWGAAGDRAALLFEVGGFIAGFALVRFGPPHQVAEFLMLPKYRRRGLGTKAAREVLSRWPGEWITHETLGNDGAIEFWQRAIPVPFAETSNATGTTQRFTIPE
jgi:predicted acetyltransferase